MSPAMVLGRVCLLLVVLSLSACGFHLRGSFMLPAWMDKVYVQDLSPPNEITSYLRQALKTSGASITDSSGTATAVLLLGREKVSRRLLAASSGSRIKDYELRYEVPLTVRNKAGKVLTDEAMITVFRELVFDEAQVLAKTAEQDAMKREMMQDAVRQIMRRLQALQPDLTTNE